MAHSIVKRMRMVENKRLLWSYKGTTPSAAKRPRSDDLIAGSVKRRKDDRTGGESALVDGEGPYYAVTQDSLRLFVGDIGKTWNREGGYDFAPSDRDRACSCCKGIHSSNNYFCRRIIDCCFYLRNYSNTCHTRILGEHEVEALTALMHQPTSDDRIVDILQLVVRDCGHRLVYTGGEGRMRWACFQGLVWEPVSDIEVEHRLKLDVNNAVVRTLIKCLTASGKTRELTKDQEKLVASLTKTEIYLSKAANVTSVAKTAKQTYLDESLPDKLDVDKDILAAANGVMELRTGKLRKASPYDYLSRFIKTDYRGIDHPTPDVDALFVSIFNDDAAVIAYVQRLLGYAITGHTREQMWAVWTGVGANGKSLLLDCLSSLLGPELYCTPAKEVFFQGGKQTSAGGHTAHLAPLQGKLIVAREERNETDRLDAELIKSMTGEGDIVSRAPYKSEYTTFKPTHLPILACNQLPAIDVDDEAMLRRLIVIPFVNVYCGPSDRVPYDSSNPHHRLKDPQLRQKMMTDANKEQLLTWLVRGAVAWYEGGLGEQPELLKSALQGYIDDNDVLHQFIRDKCDVGRDCKVKVDLLRSAYKAYCGHDIKQVVLKEMMQKRGFLQRQARIEGRNLKVYLGLTLQE